MRLIAVIECPECGSDNFTTATYCCGCGCDLPEEDNRFNHTVYLIDFEHSDDPMELFEEDFES